MARQLRDYAKENAALNAIRNYLYTPNPNFPNSRVPRREPRADARQPRERKPAKIKVGMNELSTIVLDLKRDVKLIKDAQSLVGAQRWVARHGGDRVYNVSNADVNNDNIPDIIVKDKLGKDIIINGYTTESSLWPHKHYYYTDHPTADQRRGHSFRDYVDNLYTKDYSPDGLEREFRPNAIALDEKHKSAGYKSLLPKEKVKTNQAFKQFIMKPLFAAIKEAYKTDEELEPLVIPNNAPAQVEASLRQNLVVLPILRQVYGETVLQASPAERAKLAMRKEIKEQSRYVVGNLIKSLGEEELLDMLIGALLIELQDGGVDLQIADVRGIIPSVQDIFINKYWRPLGPAVVGADETE
jgi:hypothetical protein